MKRPIAVAAVIGLLVALMGISVGADAAEDRPPIQVAEQNLDSDGAIRVSQQGTADVAVTNLPTDGSGALRIGGTVGLDPTANTVGLDPTANGVTLDPASTDLLTAIRSLLTQLSFDGSGQLEVVTPAGSDTVGLPPATRNPFGSSAGLLSLLDDDCHADFSPSGSDTALLTGLTVAADQDIQVILSFSNFGAGRSLFVEANEFLNHEFSHPLRLTEISIQGMGSGGCRMGYSFSGLPADD